MYHISGEGKKNSDTARVALRFWKSYMACNVWQW